ncbi:hypothetical protein [Chondromyces apiculatus]|nr:hypothetical protein [Chondromyces apiculatus]
MRLPSDSASSRVHASFASFTWSSLEAWSEFSALPQTDRTALLALAVALRTRIDNLLTETRATEDHVMFARPAARARQNAWLALLRRTAGEAQAMVSIRAGHSSKDHPTVREFLPKLQATITGKKITARPAAATKAASRLEGLQVAFPEKAELAERLRTVAVSAKAAVTASAAAREEWSEGRSRETVAKQRLRLELEKTHRLLGAQFPGQRDFVESFFLRGTKPSEGEEDEEEVEEAIDEGADEGEADEGEADEGAEVDEADEGDEGADEGEVEDDEVDAPASAAAPA